LRARWWNDLLALRVILIATRASVTMSYATTTRANAPRPMTLPTA
jgi:hypothetical protein